MPTSIVTRLIIGGSCAAAAAVMLPSAHAVSVSAAPPASGCNSAQVGQPKVGHAGLACGYTATGSAGFKATGTYVVTITRAGRTRTYQGDKGGCGNVGFIRKGDVVTHQGKKGTTSVIRSGPKVHC